MHREIVVTKSFTIRAVTAEYVFDVFILFEDESCQPGFEIIVTVIVSADGTQRHESAAVQMTDPVR